MRAVCKVNLYKKGLSADEILPYISDEEIEGKNKVLEYMRNPDFEEAVTSDKVFDYINNSATDIEMSAYGDGVFDWDDRDIYYFEKYNIALDPAFISRAIRA
ncbi:MAG: hypothetical protein ACI4KM_07495 [Oscillospiraceae bacterium]